MDVEPIITVNVITYNSSKYVLDTLESIKGQTYNRLILHVSDDCSSDNTLSICKKWLEDNKERFIETSLIVSERNTGVSANFNRAWDAAETEWIKDIAGDDLLLPNCIEDNVEYIRNHPDSVVVFSRVRPFMVKFGRIKWREESWHNYSFFKMTPQEQYHYLLYEGNHIPAAPCFYNIKRLRELNIRHDERIPLLEDYPKWIVFARKGIRLDFLDKHTVGYRNDPKSLSIGFYSPQFYKSNLLFYLYYYQDEIKSENDRDGIYNLMCDEALKFYKNTYSIVTSKDYRLGRLILTPLRLVKTLFLR